MPGISAVYSSKDATLKTYYALIETQHRAQENAGISTAGDNSLRTYKGKGFISTVFTDQALKTLLHPSDYVSIGHVGKIIAEEKDIAPVELRLNDYAFAVAMDGKIFNRTELNRKFGFQATNDEELFGRIFYKNLKNSNFEDAAQLTMEELQDSSYFSLAMIALNKKDGESQLLALRDKRGVKPMYMGINDNNVVVTSESGAVDTLMLLEKKKMDTRDVKPGEMILANKDEIGTRQLVPSEQALCIFEPVYFARQDTIIEGRGVHEVRKELGRSLATLHNITNDGKTIIIYVPETGESVALGLHEVTGIPYDKGMIKNQYVGRTFDIADIDKRRIASFLKHGPIKPTVAHKNLIIADDSIVKGGETRAIDEMYKFLTDVGEIRYAISYAPIVDFCIGDEQRERLAAYEFRGKNVFEIGKCVAEKIGVKEVWYNTPENVINAVGIPIDRLCTKCMTCRDPFKK
jgi:amidophosphoribosyltransferase